MISWFLFHEKKFFFAPFCSTINYEKTVELTTKIESMINSN